MYRLSWYLIGLSLVFTVLVFALGFLFVSRLFDTPREYGKVIAKTYEPNPQSSTKKITQEVVEKAGFQVLDGVY